MKRLSLLLLAALLFEPIDVRAEPRRPRTPNLGEVETKWLGIMFAISRLERIQDNRLLVFVRVTATSESARKGTFLGSESPDSSGATEADNPDRKPFSLASTIMTDDQTQQRYPVLPPVAPPGKAYFPGELVSGLHPGQGETLTIQFAAPPWLPASQGGKPAKQTVSFVLPGAKGPIANVPVPALPSDQ
jgi:hypothetical protein